MGTWSASVTANDTAADLRSEYNAAFFYNDIPAALEKIERYVRKNICDESDEEEWCNYVYSLADFMWKKGILTEEVKARVLSMIDSGYGLDIWKEVSENALNARKKALEKFRAQITSPQPPKKKIKVDAHLENIFNDGDIIAFRLQTAGKRYAAQSERPMSDEEFHALDGKYVVAQKIDGHPSWQSAIEPAVKDWWVTMRLFDGIYDDPSEFDLSSAKDAAFSESGAITPLFTCESSITYFRRRKYVLLGNDKASAKKYQEKNRCCVFMGVNHDTCNTDSSLLGAIGKALILKPCDDADIIGPLWGRIRASLVKKGRGVSMLEYNQMRADERQAGAAEVAASLSEGARYFIAEFGNPVGMICISENRLERLGVEHLHRRRGYGTRLLECAAEQVGNGVYIDIPADDKPLLQTCKKAGFVPAEGAADGYIRMSRNI